MIIKNYEVNKINLEKNKYILFYGKNEGYKNDTIQSLTKDLSEKINYDEKEILENTTIFFEQIINQSLFEEKKLILIRRATDKILSIIKELISRNVEDINIIINCENLEKKSKLRNFFEKSKNCICVPFYPDNDQTLIKLAFNFFKEKKISISQADINLIINKCNGDREALNNELEKIKLFCMKNKKISTENLIQLINLNENYSVSELVDN